MCFLLEFAPQQDVVLVVFRLVIKAGRRYGEINSSRLDKWRAIRAIDPFISRPCVFLWPETLLQTDAAGRQIDFNVALSLFLSDVVTIRIKLYAAFLHPHNWNNTLLRRVETDIAVHIFCKKIQCTKYCIFWTYFVEIKKKIKKKNVFTLVFFCTKKHILHWKNCTTKHMGSPKKKCFSVSCLGWSHNNNVVFYSVDYRIFNCFFFLYQ